jgi:drug/metabolite transporter (DMT)-like permease
VKPGNVALLLCLAALWGGSYLCIRVAAPALGVLPVVALRVSIACVALLGYAALLRDLPDVRAWWRAFLALGLLNNAIPFVLIANAVVSLNASVAAILNATTPLFTAIVAAVWLGETFDARRAAGVALGIGGVAVIVGWSPLPISGRVLLAVAQALLAALAYGLAAVYARRRFAGSRSLHTATGQLAGSSAILVPLMFVAPPPGEASGRVVVAVLALALACTALGYLIYFHLIASAGATQAATVTFLIPCFSTLWGALFLGEPLGAGLFLGLAVILCGVWLVIGPKREARRGAVIARAAAGEG